MRLLVGCVCLLVVLATTGVQGRVRDYYVAAVEEEWDYAPPGGGDLTSYQSLDPHDPLNQDSLQSVFLGAGPGRIGRKYVKVMYREFTDATFSQRKPREAWMGLLGPVLTGETGDVMRITFKNMAVLAARNFSMHPHGVQYTKRNEGALYLDGTSGADKLDDGVRPGQIYVYEWLVTDTASPGPDDPDCLTWVYHSHVKTAKDVNTGLIGGLLTCRPGGEARVSRDYAAQFTVLLDIMDENESWLLEHNVETYLGLTDTQAVATLMEDEDFQESNKMHGINGVLYGHLKGLQACEGSKVMWHLIGFGTETDIHALSLSGHSFLVDKRSVDAVRMSPVDFFTATMTVQKPGRWQLICSVLDHLNGGMVAFFDATDCAGTKAKTRGQRRGLTRIPTMGSIWGSIWGSTKVTTIGSVWGSIWGSIWSSARGQASRAQAAKAQASRDETATPVSIKRYHIAIEEVDWNYAPGGNDLFNGGSLTRPNSDSLPFFQRDSTRVGSTYRKAAYRQYSDCYFSRATPRPTRETHLGFLGPVLRLEVEDMVVITLKNNAGQPFSLHPHGATFLKTSEGALYNDSTTADDHRDDYVPPGGKVTYYWSIPADMGPGPLDPPCITRYYTSSSRDIERDAATGLVGPIVVCRKGALDWRNRQRQIDREFFVMMSVTDENKSWYRDYNFRNLRVNLDDEDFTSSNIMHSLNGLMYGTLPGLDACLGDRVVWHVFSAWTEQDVHSLYVHGQPVTLLDTRVSAAFVLPGVFTTLYMKAVNEGQWSVQCQTNDHYLWGAAALLHVQDCGLRRNQDAPVPAATARHYFLQAEESVWDYLPSGKDLTHGQDLSDPDSDGHIFTTSEGPYLGTRYLKARYIQYTDATFTQKVPRAESDQYLGFLGPVITAEAYDVIKVVFRNAASRAYSIHAQGLFYNKSSEGATYGGDDGAVQPGETRTYEWSVPAEFAPAEGDPDCINQAYYSAVDPVRDTYSGLIGPLVLCKPGFLDGATGARTDVPQWFVLHFEVMDEARSWYIDHNIQMHGNSASRDDPDFGESNLMHSINGYLYGNQPSMEMSLNSEVAWHLMSLGNEVDIHSVHFHANDVRVFQGGVHTRDVSQLFPGTFQTVHMNASMAGTWLLHCHVHDHLVAGMETVYVVTP